MATFLRIRRLHRTPLRIGPVNVTNARSGSMIDVDDPAVRRDMKNQYDRWIFVERHNASAFNFPTVQVLTLAGTGGANTFKLTYGATEGATVFTKASNQTAAAIQAALRTATNDGSLTVAGTTDAGPFTITFVANVSPALISLTSPTGGVSGVVTTNANTSVAVNNMQPTDATGTLTGANIFGGATGGTEYAFVMNLPDNFTVKTVTMYVATAGGAATTHGWLTVASYDGVGTLTYQAATADVTSGTIATGARAFSPVVSGSTPYVTSQEGQYVFTMTEVVGSSTTPAYAGVAMATAAVASRLAGPVPVNVNTYGNPGTVLLNSWGAATGASGQTTPPVVGTTSAIGKYTPVAFLPYVEVNNV